MIGELAAIGAAYLLWKKSQSTPAATTANQSSIGGIIDTASSELGLGKPIVEGGTPSTATPSAAPCCGIGVSNSSLPPLPQPPRISSPQGSGTSLVSPPQESGASLISPSTTPILQRLGLL